MSEAPSNRYSLWFRKVWPAGRWRLVLDEYQSLRKHKALLADIAARGGIYSTHFIASEREAAFMEGRRALALEILALAGMDPDKLRTLIETPIERNRP